MSHSSNFRFILRLVSFVSLMMYITRSVDASPWIGTLDPQLHHDLQTLSEWGYLDTVTSSYPLPWKGISQQLKQLDSSQLPPGAAVAARRLQHYLQLEQQQLSRSIVSLYAANEQSRFSGFDAEQAPKAKLTISNEFYRGRWAGQLSLNRLPGGENNLDQSFIAYQFGDWNLRLGAMDQWWGPAHSSSLIMSNNARPIPALAFSRSQATESQDSWLSLLGPWYFTAQLGQLESSRAIPDAKVWMSRFNFKPLSGLEIGASWVAMWGGQNQGNGLSDLFDVLTFQTKCANGEDNCDAELNTKNGNHLAGFDIKYSFSLWQQPFSIYAQRIGEDAADYYSVTDQADLYGISSYLWGSKIYLEASDTNIACAGDGSTVNNCYYEHSDYKNGYRFHNRAIGSTFDSDAKMLTLGFNKHFSDGDVMEIVLRRLELNPDQQKPSPVVSGLTEELLQLGGFYQTNLGNWQFKLGGQVESSEADMQASETDSLIYTQIKYNLR